MHLRDFGIPEFFVKEGLVDVEPLVWTCEDIKGSSKLMVRKLHMVIPTALGLTSMAQVGSIPDLLVKKTNVMEKAKSLIETLSNYQAKTHLKDLLIKLNERKVNNSAVVALNPMDDSLTVPSIILCCSYCNKESSAELSLKKCGRCLKTQYCGRFTVLLFSSKSTDNANYE